MTQHESPLADETAERAVLGALLADARQIPAVADLIGGPADFYATHHGDIYRAVLSLWQDGKPTDPVTVATKLGTDWCRRRPTYLADLFAAAGITASASYHARLVAEYAGRRRLHEAGCRIVNAAKASDPDLSLTDRLAAASDALTAAHGAPESMADRQTFAELIDSTLAEVSERHDRGDVMAGAPTGFADLDRMLGGLQSGQLIVIGARPGLGKSTLCLDFARCAALRHNIPTLFFTLEMSKSELVLRTLSAEARVQLHSLRSGRLDKLDIKKLTRRVGEVAAAPLHILDDPTANLVKIKAEAQRVSAVEGRPVGLVVVDYLQLMPTAGGRRDGSREQEVAANSRGLKLLAKELGAPIVVASQLNRNSEHRIDKRPQLSDLRESGAVEMDADIVLLLHREDYYDKESPRTGEADIIVAKHRNGPTDTVTVHSQLHLSRFSDMSL